MMSVLTGGDEDQFDQKIADVSINKSIKCFD